MDAGVDKNKTHMGTFCTLLWFVIIMSYAANKIDILINKKDTSILAATRDLYFSSQDQFDSSQGLNIAVAFTAFDSETAWSLDPSYGELSINQYEWGIREDGTTFTDRSPLQTHNCTLKELNLENDESDASFYPINEHNVDTLEAYWRKMLCINQQDARIYGDFNSANARQLNVQLKRCQGPGCKTEEQITEFFKKKYILLLVNEARFVTDRYGEERVAKESRLVWLRINTFVPLTERYSISQTELALQDRLFNFADLTRVLDKDVFQLKHVKSESYEKNDGTQFDITLEHDPDLQIVNRSGYTVLDLIANVGGLRTIMAFVITYAMSYWNFNKP